MTILHGSWLIQSNAETTSPTGCFFLWGEVWRRVNPPEWKDNEILPHPFCMDQGELIELMRSLQASSQIQWPISDISLDTAEKSLGDRWQPSTIQLPSYSPPPVKKSRSKKKPPVTLLPQHSATQVIDTDDEEAPVPVSLKPWHIEGIVLTAAEAVQLLQSLVKHHQ